MKSSTQLVTVIGIALLAGCASSQAENWSDNFYVHADAGVAFVQNLKLRQVGPTVPTEFDPGTRADIAIGYNLGKSWAVELETGALWNRISKINGNSPGDGHIDLFQFPVLANVVYKIHLQNHWTPYIGGGVGADFATFDDEAFGFNESHTDVTFAYQAQAGVAYALSQNTALDFGYKFFGSLGHDWKFSPGELTSDPILTHALLVSFSWKF